MTENIHPNQTLIEETLKLMELSSMNQEERTMWTVLLPSLQKEEIEKLRDALAGEVQTMTDIYLQAKQAMSEENSQPKP
jgi:hypothetical protein